MWRKFIGLKITIMLILLMMTGVSQAQENTVHIVQRGETLYRIALYYGTSYQALAEANNITDPTRIFAGQQLVIPSFDPSPLVVDNPMVASTPIIHTVSRGETLASIARQYGLTMEQLAQINTITDPNRIYAGQQLTVWSLVPENTIPSETPGTLETVIQTIEAQPVQPAEQQMTTYTVQAGEHLAEIARRYNLSWTVIAQANNLTNPNYIFSGQVLNIPVDGATVSLDTTSYVPPLPAAPSAHIGVGREIVVDLSDSRIYAYENGALVNNILVSTGLPGTPTVQGDFSIYWKLPAQTMAGPGYYLPDVPYVMYFYEGYAIHGTYWHNNFGQPMSHGCVNLPTPDAAWFYGFAEVGTPVHVQV
ncbi:MAG: LysM peptidoglycan-binding domain-containing protein [Anaerolineaceae bacterium]|nr:LysM peptidoglycan-binding domain-containing protein [Anaerolineaceae bacterium]